MPVSNNERERIDRWISERLAYLGNLSQDELPPPLTPDEIVDEDVSVDEDDELHGERDQKYFYFASFVALFFAIIVGIVFSMQVKFS